MMTSPSKSLHLDFETESACDLKRCGVSVYARHLSTRVHCLGYRFDKENTHVWRRGDPFPERIKRHVALGLPVYAHNAEFELYIWNKVLMQMLPNLPPLKISQMYCTMSFASATGLPQALDRLGAFMGFRIRKDMSGKRTMQRLSHPPKKGDDHPKLLYNILYKYCKTDVRVESEAEEICNPLTPEERLVWLQNVRINNRGVRISRIAALAAIEVVKTEKAHITKLLAELTGGAIKSPAQTGRLTAWIQGLDPRITNLKKLNIDYWLKNFELLPEVSLALEYRQRFSKTSTSKINRMLDCIDADDRVRGLLFYHGAATGRWAGRLFQIQNLFKPPYEEDLVDGIISDVMRLLQTTGLSAEALRRGIEERAGDVLTAIASCTRAMIIPDEGTRLGIVDYSNIEGRMLAFVAGEEWKLEAFRACDRGEYKDLYVVSYGETFGVSIDQVSKSQRSIGKVMELAFGYAGSIGAWRKFDSKLPRYDEAQVKEINRKWRERHPATKKLWRGLEAAAIRALRSPGSIQLGSRKEVPILFKYLEKEDFLILKLPSGRCIFYPRPRLEDTQYGTGIIYETIKKSGNKRIVSFWQGMITENVIQAMAADILRYALRELEKENFDIVFHVHDEIVVNLFEHTLKEMENIMIKRLPEWATGFPIAVAGIEAMEYCK